MPSAKDKLAPPPPDTVFKMQEMLQRWPPLTNLRALNRLRVLLVLAEGTPAAKARHAGGVSAQAARNIQRDVSSQGWDAIIENFEELLAKPPGKFQDGRGRGRPAIPTLNEFEKTLKPQTEAIVALVGIYVSGSARIAVLACRGPLNDASEANWAGLLSAVREAFSPLDTEMPVMPMDPIVGRLIEGILNLRDWSKKLRKGTVCVRQLKSERDADEQLSGKWRFFSAEAGDQNALDVYKKRMCGARECGVTSVPIDDFFTTLLNTISILRLRMPIVGLFPMRGALGRVGCHAHPGVHLHGQR